MPSPASSTHPPQAGAPQLWEGMESVTGPLSGQGTVRGALSPASSRRQIGGVLKGRIGQSCKFWLRRQPVCASRGLGHMPGKLSGPGWFLLQPQAGTVRRVGAEHKWACLHTPDA